jgi:hypothetical protein
MWGFKMTELTIKLSTKELRTVIALIANKIMYNEYMIQKSDTETVKQVGELENQELETILKKLDEQIEG